MEIESSLTFMTAEADVNTEIFYKQAYFQNFQRYEKLCFIGTESKAIVALISFTTQNLFQ